jgi:hypothetical protein
VERVGSEIEARFAPLQARVDQAERTVTQQSARLDTAQTNHQENFSAAEAARSQRFDTYIAEHDEAAKQAASAAAQTMDEARSEFDRTANEVIESLKAHEQQARDLASAVAAQDVAGGYGKYATDERSAADFWRWAGIVLGLAGMAWVIYTILPLLNGSTVAGVELSFLARLAGATPAFLLAIYAFRESSKHRNAYHAARELSVQFAALEPFLALLPPEKRVAVREKMADFLFQAHPGPTARTADGPDEGLIALATKALDRIPKA